jgi:HAD superfamily hydrolase (TIGR01662 family)
VSAAGPRWVCLDVGETLIDETRVWTVWADALGIPAMTFLAALGAAVDRGLDHASVFDVLEVPDWETHSDEVERRYGGFQAGDLYPDALPALASLRDAGCRIAVIANQPAIREAQLRELGVHADVMAMSETMGTWKPQPAFFARALELMGGPTPADVAYVGDRPDNDVRPAAAAGMRAVWLRRGPWGHIRSEAPEAHLVVRSLTELVDRLDEAWPDVADRSALA